MRCYVLTVVCVVLLCSDSAMGGVMFLQCYVWCCYVLTVLWAVLCSYSAMCGVVMFLQCYVWCCYVLTVLCAVLLCSFSAMFDVGMF